MTRHHGEPPPDVADAIPRPIMKLARTDMKIIEVLQQDGRATNKQIAIQLEVSEETVRRHRQSLVSEGVIRIVGIPNYEKAGYEAEAVVAVTVEPDKIDQVADALAKMDEVDWVSITTGSYDIFLHTNAKSQDDLGQLLRNHVGTIPGVMRMETFVSLAVLKREYGVRT